MRKGVYERGSSAEGGVCRWEREYNDGEGVEEWVSIALLREVGVQRKYRMKKIRTATGYFKFLYLWNIKFR